MFNSLFGGRITYFIFYPQNILFLNLFSDGPYAGFAGRDASRGLATFSVEAITDEYDDLLDLKASEIEQVCTL